MAKPVEQIEEEIRRLAPDQLREFRAWFQEFDADSWDEQIASDAAAGKLDDLAGAALNDHAAGRSKKL